MSSIDRPGRVSGDLLDTAFSARPDRLAAVVRAERRMLDAEAEFDAALDAGLPVWELARRDHELLMAVTARRGAVAMSCLQLADRGSRQPST